MENHSIVGLSLALLLGAYGGMPKDLVEIRPSKTIETKVGEETKIVIGISLKKGFHIQANPTSDPTLIPTSIEIERVPGLQIGSPIYPAGKPYKLQSGKELSAYEGVVDFILPVTPKSVGTFQLKGTLRYQACDAKSCFFPTTVPFQSEVNVSAPFNRIDRSHISK